MGIESLTARSENATCTARIVNEEPGEWLALQAIVRNDSDKPIRLAGIEWTGNPVLPRKSPGRYFHTENIRQDFFDTGTIYRDRYWKELSDEAVELGWSEDAVFPGVFLGSENEPHGLFVAAATQERCHLIWRLSRTTFSFRENLTGLDWIELPAGGEWRGETIFLALAPTSDPQSATDSYYAYLRKTGLFARRDKSNPLPRQRIWCSWNYGIWAETTEALCYEHLPIFKKHFPTVGFLQIDDGYQRVYQNGHQAQIDFVYGAGPAFDQKKYPSSPREFTSRIKAAGLRPAIWLGLWATESSPMLAEHPDWVLRLKDGSPLRVGPDPTPEHPDPRRQCVLDVSVPGVRDYLDFMCRTVFQEWGFEGVKLDFSSFAFECKRCRYQNPGRTAPEYRRWLMEMFRKYLPVDGFFGWCVVCGTGNPLYAAGGADYFRCAEDIGEGHWPMVKNIATWCANTGMLMQERPILPNIDSIGWSRYWTQTQWQTWLNLAAVTGMAIEVSGNLTQLDDATLHRLNRTLELSDPARRVRCLDLPHGKVESPPRLWLAEGNDEAYLAIFNWSDAPATTDLPKLAEGAVDAWTGASFRPSMLPPHGSVLLRLVK
ncbi:MAG: alpha-galactosidase [Phycisphaeraceae bacterium]|nr:alpha-galactosidase [Phycisphaeraceae bacterium]